MSHAAAYFHWHLGKEGVSAGALWMKYFRKSTEIERWSLAHYFRHFSLWLLKPDAFGEAEYHVRKAARKKWTPYALT